jgi:hypothetical protein
VALGAGDDLPGRAEVDGGDIEGDAVAKLGQGGDRAGDRGGAVAHPQLHPAGRTRGRWWRRGGGAGGEQDEGDEASEGTHAVLLF